MFQLPFIFFRQYIFHGLFCFHVLNMPWGLQTCLSFLLPWNFFGRSFYSQGPLIDWSYQAGLPSTSDPRRLSFLCLCHHPTPYYSLSVHLFCSPSYKLKLYISCQLTVSPSDYSLWILWNSCFFTHIRIIFKNTNMLIYWGLAKWWYSIISPFTYYPECFYIEKGR